MDDSMNGILNRKGVQPTEQQFHAQRLLELLQETVQRAERAREAWLTYHQLSVNARPGAPDPFVDGVGSLYSHAEKRWHTETRDFSVRTIKDAWLNDQIMKVEEYAKERGVRVGRIRYMNQRPKTCLSYHTDPEAFRLHIPLLTNDKAFFIVDDRLYTMPRTGQLYELRTDVRHTALNANEDQDRIHLVFDTYRPERISSP